MTTSPPPYPWDISGRLRGIDISRFNPLTPADWLKIKSVCVFASIKASESTSTDSMFRTHADNGARVGVDLQAYGFIRSATNGQAQAEAMCRVLDACPHPFKAREVMDWEDMHRVNRKEGGVGSQIALSNGLSFLRTIRRLRGRAPAVYTGKGFIDLFQELFDDDAYKDDLVELATHDLWVASYRWDPVTGHDYQIVKPKMPPLWADAYAWQARGDKGPSIVPGLTKPLDGDVFFGDQAAWDMWCADAPTREPGLRLDTPGAAATSLADEVHRLAETRKD